MDIKLLKAAINQNNIPKFMGFVVEEPALCKQYINKISTLLGLPYKFYMSVDDALYDITNDFRNEYIYIILNDNKILQGPDFIEALKNSNKNIIIYFTEIDIKNKIYLNNKDYFVFFNKLSKYTIISYLLNILNSNKITVDQEKIETLVDYCNGSLSCCLNELDKIIALDQTNSNMVFDYMLEKGFSDYRQTNLFSFIYKVLDGNSIILDEATRLDESFIGLVTILYKQAHNKVMSDPSSKDLYKYINVMRLCSLLDCGIKDGTVSDKYALDYLLIKVLNGKL